MCVLGRDGGRQRGREGDRERVCVCVLGREGGREAERERERDSE